MAIEGQMFKTTIVAGADYSGGGGQYHAIAVADGQLAAGGYEATGILLNKPNTGEGAEVGYSGEMKFAAGGAVAKGAKVTVSASGWFVTAGSGYFVVGECQAAVTSGSIGTGIFQFASAPYAFSSSYVL